MAEMLPPERLAAIWERERRMSEYNPEPWDIEEHTAPHFNDEDGNSRGGEGMGLYEVYTVIEADGSVDELTIAPRLNKPTAEFIAYARQDIPDLRDHITAQAERIAALEVALKPFAALAEHIFEGEPDDKALIACLAEPDEDPEQTVFTIGDVRRAAEVYSKLPGGGQGE